MNTRLFFFRAAILLHGFLVATQLELRAQTVMPLSITFPAGNPLCAGGSTNFPVKITLPPGTTIDKVDVFLLFDDTGSFSSFVPTVTSIFSDLVSSLEMALPGVEFGFGVGRFEDYGGPGIGFSGDNNVARPFILNQPIVTAATAGSAAARNGLINTALSHTAPGGGGDGPESSVGEGLYQVATGLGFDGNGNGSSLNSGPAGALATQTSPGTSGDVPPFSSNVLPTSGTLGGVGFRSGALHLVILATDICPVAAFPHGLPVPSTISGAGSSSEPTTAFVCPPATLGVERYGFVSDAKSVGANTVANAVAPSDAAAIPATVAALNGLGIRVLGMGPGSAPTTSPGPSSSPSVWLSAMARLTGAIDGNGDALVFSTSVSLGTLTTKITEAITTTTTLPVDIGLGHTPLPANLGFSFAPAVVPMVPPGGMAQFVVTLTGNGPPPPNGSFDLNFVAVASGSVLDSIPVTVVCPPNVSPVAICMSATVVAPASCFTNVSVNAGSFDPDGDAITITQTPPGPYFRGTTAVVLTVTDTNGAFNTCTALVTVLDRNAPIILCPPKLMVECGDPVLPPATGTATATDNCDTNPLVAFYDSTVVEVTSGTPHGWSFALEGTPLTAVGAYVEGPGVPPIGSGSAHLAMGSNGNGMADLVSTSYGGTRLASLTELSYWTYRTQDSPGGNQSIYISLAIDHDGNGSIDDVLVFEPKYQHGSNPALPDQGPLVNNVWQCWNALAGGWWSENHPGLMSPGAGVELLSLYLAAFPDAVIRNNVGGGGVRLSTGDIGAWEDFDGYVDAFTLGTNGVSTTFDFERTPGNPCGNTVIVRTWTATDASTNRVFCSQFIRVIDTRGPDLVCPESLNVTNDPGRCSAVVLYTVTARDPCDPHPSLVCLPAPGFVFPVGSTLVSCTSTDACGNVSTCSFPVTVRDVEPPALACPPDLTAIAHPTTCVATNVNLGIPLVSDNCGLQGVTNNAPPVLPLGMTLVTWKATDIYGNMTTCTQKVTVIELQKPFITCVQDAVVQCGAPTDPSATGRPTATDNCDPAPVVTFTDRTAVEVLPGNLQGWSLTTVLTASATLVGGPPTPPFSTGSLRLRIGANGSASARARLAAYEGTPLRQISELSYWSYRAVDLGVGQNVYVILNVDLDGDNNPDDLLIFEPKYQNGSNPALPVQGPVLLNTWQRWNACVGGWYSENHPNVASRGGGVQPLSVYVAAFPNARIIAAATGQGGVSLLAGLGLGIWETFEGYADCFTIGTNGVSTTYDFDVTSGDVCPIKQVILRTWTARDTSGNQKSCTQKITVIDTIPPVLTCPSNIVTVTLPEQCSRLVTFTATATDNCTTNPALGCVPPSATVFPLGTTLVRCTATDDCTNASSCTFTVTVLDVTPPVITCPSNLVRNTDPGRCAATVNFAPLASDDCPGVVFVCAPPSGFAFPKGLTTVTCVATDISSNTATCSFTVTVIDNEPPLLVCPTNLTRTTDPGLCRAVINFTPLVSDNCPGVGFFCVPPSGFAFPKGTTNVQCTATDGATNITRCTFEVTVLDREPPVLTCPSNITVTCIGTNGTPVSYAVTAADNCDPVTPVCAPPSGTRFIPGTYPVLCTGSDSSGNSNSCAFVIRVLDGIKPDLTCPPDALVQCGQPTGTNATGRGTATDDCDPNPLVTFADSPGVEVWPGAFGNWQLAQTLTAMAELVSGPGALPCGTGSLRLANGTNCDAVAEARNPDYHLVRLNDLTELSFWNYRSVNNPDLLDVYVILDVDTDGNGLPDDLLVFEPRYQDGDNPALPFQGPVATGVWQFWNALAGGWHSAFHPDVAAPGPGVQSITTYIAAFPNARLANTLLGEGAVRLTAGRGVGNWENFDGNADRFTIGTNGVSRSFDFEITPGTTCPVTDVILRTWTATDQAGNKKSCTQKIAIIDTLPPVVTCAPNQVVECGVSWNFTRPTATDTCSGTNVTIRTLTTVTNVRCGNTFVATRIWEITDLCTNRTGCTQTVTVVDTTAPMLTCAPNQSIACGTPWDFTRPTAFDTCDGTNVVLVIVGTTTNALCGRTFSATRLWRATDSCSNATTCSQTITVVDMTPPNLTCADNLEVECGAVWNFTRPTAFDLCDGTNVVVVITGTVTNGLCGSTYRATRSWSATDLCGNQSTCAQMVTVIDRTPPMVECPSNMLVECGSPILFGKPWAMDNCDGTNVIMDVISTVTNTGVAQCFRLFTTDADFDQGTLLNVNHDIVHHQLQLNQVAQPLPFVYIACSERGTAVRIDVNTGQVLGEFQTAPTGMGRDPSRTTVDRFGNVWVANRAEVGFSGGENKGSMTRIGLILGGTRGRKNLDGSFTPDPTGEYLQPPFLYNTCTDRDSDGLIRTSRGLGHILAWSNAGGADTHGGVATANDECIINYTRVAGTATRTVAIDANNDIWTGGYGDLDHEKVSGVTGLPIPGTRFNVGCGAYGGLIDGHGVLWSARGGSGLLRYDTATPVPPAAGSVFACLDGSHGDYGLGIDPISGHVWHTGLSSGRVVELAENGSVLNSYPYGNGNAQGVAVDGSSNVWVAHSLFSATTVGHLRTDGTFVGNVALGGDGNGPTGVAVDANGKVWVACLNSSTAKRINPNAGGSGGGGFPVGAVDLTVNLNAAGGVNAGPYNYSDMTGFVAIGSTSPSGTWTVIHNSLATGTGWGRLNWTATTPAGTSLRVEVRAADNVLDLPARPFVTVENGVSFCTAGVMGQFLEVRVTFTRTVQASISPVLEDLSVECCNPVTGPACGYRVTRTWRFTDQCTNSTLCRQTINVVDTTPPLVSCAGNQTVECGTTWSFTRPTAMDLCDGTNVTIRIINTVTNALCGRTVAATRTWEVLDSCTNRATCTQTITEVDTIPPTLNCGKDQTVECGTTWMFSMPMASDNCDGTNMTIRIISTVTNALCGRTYAVTRAWEVFDFCTNRATCSQTIAVVDTTPPLLTCAPNQMFECGAVWAFVTPSAVDICDGTNVAISVVSTVTNLTCGRAFSVSRTWRATDICSNSATCSQTVTVRDTIPPVLVGLPTNSTYQCLGDIPALPFVTAFDACDGTNVTVRLTLTTNGICPTTLVYSWLAADGCSNTVTAVRTNVVRDTIPPVLVGVPLPRVVQCLADLPPTSLVTATDNCDGTNVAVTFTKATNGVCPTLIICTWRATDRCTNSATASVTNIVRDTIPPVLVGLPTNRTFQCLGDVPPPPAVGAFDNCDSNVTVFVNSSFSGSCPAFVVWTWSAFDRCTNFTTASRTNTVLDTIPPVLVGVPTNRLFQCLADVPPSTGVVATDNCDTNVLVTLIRTTNGTCPMVIVSRWTATDACTNTATAFQTNTVVDTIPPVLVGLPRGTNVQCLANLPPLTPVTATDNCDTNVTVTRVSTTNGVCPIRVVHTWTATDDCTNSTLASVTNLVLDTIPPVLVGVPTNRVFQCLADMPPPAGVFATDNCDTNVQVTLVRTTNGICPLIIVHTWTATDNCTNRATASVTNLVLDTIPPVLVGVPTNRTFQCLADVPPLAGVTATDNCDTNVTVTRTTTTNGVCPLIIVHTWTATDDCTNRASASVTNFVRDTIPPALVGVPTNSAFQCLADVPPPPVVAATDNCDGANAVVIRVSTTNGLCPTIIVHRWTAIDRCTNSTSATQTITVRDTIPPTLAGVPADLTVDCPANVPPPVLVFASDNCDGTNLLVRLESTTNGPCPLVISYCWSATDRCSNTVTACQRITVQPPPLLLVRGLEDQTRCLGGAVTLCGEISSPCGVTYQWFKDGLAMAGATGSCLTLSGMTHADGGGYCQVVTSPCRSLTNCARVTVLDCVPCLTIHKLRNRSSTPIGGPVTYTYVVSNCGDVALTNVVVTDDYGTPDFVRDDVTVGTVPVLLPHATVAFERTVMLPVTLCDAGTSLPSGMLVSEVLPDGNYRVSFIQASDVNDNTYGTNSLGWGGRIHKFNDLTGSDHVSWEFRNGAGQLALAFNQDYLSAASTALFPSGFGCLGFGGDGDPPTVGSAAHVLDFSSSLEENLNKQPFLGALAQYTVNSPALNDPNASAWEYRMIYTVVLDPAAFGASGLGRISIVDQHNSPGKRSVANPQPCDSCITNLALATVQSGTNTLRVSDTAVVCVCPAINQCNPMSDCTVPYPFASTNARTSLVFSESEILRAFTVSVTNNCMPQQIRAYYNDEHALVLGVRRVVVKTAAGLTTNNYPITPLATNPGGIINPLVGSTAVSGDQAGTDVSGRPLFPALFLTDITTNPASLAGDWQYGGTAIPPHAVFGTWKGAVRTVDKTVTPNVATVTPDADPAENDWNLGAGDPAPPGLVNQGYGAEVRWNVSQLGLVAGHTYRLYFMVHDGDQNKVGGDAGHACAVLGVGQTQPGCNPAFGNACIDVSKEIACALPGENCSPFAHTATGYRGLTDPAFWYRITVDNCGGVALTNVTVVDDDFGDLTSEFFGAPAGTLPVGASITRYFKAARSVDTINTVIASGWGAGAASPEVAAMDRAVALVENASLTSIALAASADDLDGQPDGAHVLLPRDGSPHSVQFRLVVCNNGAVDLENVQITAPALAQLGCAPPTPFSLAVGACRTSILCTAGLVCSNTPLTSAVAVTADVSPISGLCGYDMTGSRILVGAGASQAVVECVAAAAVPLLSIDRMIPATTNVVLSWPGSGGSGLVLEFNDELLSPNSWYPVTVPATLVNGRYSVMVPAVNVSRCFRLRRP